MKFKDFSRASILSFDFRQTGQNQSRKTKFFRELYGYTQQIKQKLKSGKTITRRYHYSGLLDKIPHVKLGKSVFGVQPGREDPIIQLFESYDEVIYYNFIGWLPTTVWPVKDEVLLECSRLIEQYGYLSVLIKLRKMEGRIHQDQIPAIGFDPRYAIKATEYLFTHGWLEKIGASLVLTSNGGALVSRLV